MLETNNLGASNFPEAPKFHTRKQASFLYIIIYIKITAPYSPDMMIVTTLTISVTFTSPSPLTSAASCLKLLEGFPII